MDQNNNIETVAEQSEVLEEKVTEQSAVNAVSADTEPVIAAAKAEHSEPVSLPVAAPTTQIAAIPEKPKKKGYLKMFISAVLACGVVVAGLWAARTFLIPSPEAVIKKAAITTVANHSKIDKSVAEAIPALPKLFEANTYKDEQSSFNFTISSIEEVPYARMISAILSGFELSGSSATSTAENASSLSAKISYDDKSVLDADFYLSPGLITLSVPELTDKTLSVVPSAFADDYSNSFIGRVYPLERQQLAAIQNSMTSFFEQRAGYTPEAIDGMKKDMLNIMAGCFENAQYGYDKDSKLYCVDLAGNHVKDSVISLFRYIYLDSAAAPSLKKSLEPSLASEGVESYEQLIDKMTADLQATLPDMPISTKLNIEKNLIKNASSVCVPVDKSVIKGFTFDAALSDTSNFFKFSADFIDNGIENTLLADIATDYKNDAFAIDGDISVKSEGVSLAIPINFSISKSGDYHSAVSFDAVENGRTGLIKFSADGTVNMDGDKLVYRLDDCSASASFGDYEPIVLSFAVNGENAPLSDIPAAPEKHVGLLNMSERDIWDLAYESYNNFGKIAKLINRLWAPF